MGDQLERGQGTPLGVDVGVNTRVALSRIDDLLCCAFEGGSTYWCNKVDVVGEWPGGAEYAHEVLTRGGTIEVTHEGGDTKAVVKPEHVQIALETMAREYPKHWSDFIAENEDADTGDVFFQLVCFGEVVYG